MALQSSNVARRRERNRRTGRPNGGWRSSATAYDGATISVCNEYFVLVAERVQSFSAGRSGEQSKQQLANGAQSAVQTSCLSVSLAIPDQSLLVEFDAS